MSTRVGAKTKGYIKRIDTGQLYPFQFNPEQFQYSRSVSYQDIISPGCSYPRTQFVAGQSRSFPVELFMYDRPYSGLIYDSMFTLGDLLTPERNSKWAPTKPPDFIFCLGYFIRRCVLESIDITIEQMDDSGQPIQARFNLQVRQVSPV